MSWKYFNPNPAGRVVGDCSVRAVSAALDTSWEEAYELICDAGYRIYIPTNFDYARIRNVIVLCNTMDSYLDTINNGICPTVTMNNYILKDILEEKGYTTLVEERSIKDILTLNNLNYSGSYIASRIYLDDVRNRFPSLKYFIDIHRDSVEKSNIIILFSFSGCNNLYF